MLICALTSLQEGELAFEAWRDMFAEVTTAKVKWGTDVFNDKAFSSRHISAQQKRRKMRCLFIAGEDAEELAPDAPSKV